MEIPAFFPFIRQAQRNQLTPQSLVYIKLPKHIAVLLQFNAFFADWCWAYAINTWRTISRPVTNKYSIYKCFLNSTPSKFFELGFKPLCKKWFQNDITRSNSKLVCTKDYCLWLKVRFDWTQSNAKRTLATFANLREWSITSLAKVANLREWLQIFATLSLHRLILITYF